MREMLEMVKDYVELINEGAQVGDYKISPQPELQLLLKDLTYNQVGDYFKGKEVSNYRELRKLYYNNEILSDMIRGLDSKEEELAYCLAYFIGVGECKVWATKIDNILRLMCR